MSWAGLDQRAFPRIAAQCDIWIGDSTAGLIKARTQNLGAGGVCVILDRELEKLSGVHLRLTLRDWPAPLECDGRVVWMVPSKELASGRVSYDIGVEFLNLKESDRERIQSFIDRHNL